MTTALVVGALVASALVVALPGHARRRVLAVGTPAAGRAGRPRSGAVLGPLAPAARHVLRAQGRGAQLLLVATVVLVAGAFGGAVAAGVAGGYAVLAVRAAARRDAVRAAAGRRTELLDLLATAAADLRAGLPVATALPGVGTGPPVDGLDGPLWSRVGAAVGLAERTGAPLADVLERVEVDTRAADRARQAAAAQAAGARATAWLLAGLPVGGLALGVVIGADPLAVLLHTPIGAACAFGAVTLQLAGLAWTRKIMRLGGALG